MRRFAVVVLALAVVLFATFSPAFAVPPTKGTYTQVIVGHTAVPGEAFLTGDILHSRGTTGEYYLYGAPFPLGNSISSSTTYNFELNIVSLTGSMLGHVVDTYAAGTIEGIVNAKFNGPDLYVYVGPTFTFTLGTVTATLTTGDVFAGLVYDVLVVKHGTGDLAGFTMKGTSEGVDVSAVIVGDPDMVGMGLDFETGTYSW